MFYCLAVLRLRVGGPVLRLAISIDNIVNVLVLQLRYVCAYDQPPFMACL